ncbi:MAG TPA: lysylphosphatidylglycerol synthase transmembrane domain-containing protein, partial [Actinotalea sp.]
RVGAERAVASAARCLADDDLAAAGPLLQSIALPRATRDEARKHKGLLAEVREALLARLPEADVEPERLVRFGLRTVLIIAVTIAVVFTVITTIQFDLVTAALATAAQEPLWIATAFGLGMVTFLGSAMALVAFAPIRMSLWRVTLVQAASSFVALAAPAGVGPAALNLRMLTRRGIPNALAVASVGLVQVSQLITTIGLLIVLSLVSGTQEPLTMPSPTVLIAVALLIIGVTSAMLVPRVRQWVLARTVPVWKQTWPRLVQMMGQPRRLLVALAGNLLMTLGYLGAFDACLAAFGYQLSPIDLAVIYLFGNAAGALAPSPGGLGAVEGALITGLSGPGHVPLAIATSVVVLFRALTYWGRAPFGWLAMRVLQRSGEL